MHAGAKIKNSRQRGFSLVEMLVVISIVALLLGMSQLMSNGVIKSVDLTATSERVLSIFNSAREEAVTRNQNVQVRIYSRDGVYSEIGVGVLSAPEDPSDPNYNDPTAFEFERLRGNVILPESVSIIEGEYSTVLGGSSSSNLTVDVGTETINGVSLQYSAISFRPNSRVRLATDQAWTLTIGESNGSSTVNELPSNFFTIQLDPNTARAFVLRP